MDVTETKNHPQTNYYAEKHTDDYQPPMGIRQFKALGRDVLLNGIRTTFFFGTGKNDTRVNFLFAGVWYHITMGDQTVDKLGNRPNLFPLLKDLKNEFNFVTLG